ncbi:MAG: tRNA (N6-isopentenyl adenosine(37)-C2)-methylthiotransferase MiaB [Armatimonadota bacterium]
MIITWGCQMNEDDSQQMANLLEQMGYRQTDSESDADIIILNTCSVRAKPEQKVKSKLGELRFLKEANSDLIIGVCGCMAQREGNALRKRAPFIDIVMGTASITDLPALIQQAKNGRRRITSTDMPEHNNGNGTSHTSRSVGEVGLKAFVPVMYGCNNFCTYCVVPYARGPERSRPPHEIIKEVTELASKGCREVTLVGQNVNSYGQTLDEHVDFAGLLELINDIPMLERIRFMTSHPKDLSDRLIEAMASLLKVCEHLHLPLQAGDNDILRRMGRRYTIEHYMELVGKLRDRIPGITLTTDIMVGFPGETEEQFKNSMNAVESIRFDGAFMFAFNARPGTAAAGMDDQIDSVTKNRRLRELIEQQNNMTFEKNRENEGQIFEVLVESVNDKEPTNMTGYSQTNKVVNFPGGPELIGQTVMVRTLKAHPWGFNGELVEP